MGDATDVVTSISNQYGKAYSELRLGAENGFGYTGWGGAMPEAATCYPGSVPIGTGYGYLSNPDLSVLVRDSSIWNFVASIGAGWGQVVAAFQNAMIMLSPYSPGSTNGITANTIGITNKSICFKDLTFEQLKKLKDKEREIKTAENNEKAEKNAEKKKALTEKLELLKAEYRDLEKKYCKGVQLSKLYGNKEYKFYTYLQGSELEQIKAISEKIEDAKKAIAKEEQKYVEKYNRTWEKVRARGGNELSETEKLVLDTEKKEIDDKKKKLAEEIQKFDEWIEKTATADTKSKKYTGKINGKTAPVIVPKPDPKMEKLVAEVSKPDTIPISEKTKILKEIKAISYEGTPDEQIEEVYNLLYKNGEIKTKAELKAYLASEGFFKQAVKVLNTEDKGKLKEIKLAIGAYINLVGRADLYDNISNLPPDIKKAMQKIIQVCVTEEKKDKETVYSKNLEKARAIAKIREQDDAQKRGVTLPPKTSAAEKAKQDKTPVDEKAAILSEITAIAPKDTPKEQIETVYNLFYKNGQIKTVGELKTYLAKEDFFKEMIKVYGTGDESKKQAKLAIDYYYKLMSQASFWRNSASLSKEIKENLKPIIQATIVQKAPDTQQSEKGKKLEEQLKKYKEYQEERIKADEAKAQEKVKPKPEPKPEPPKFDPAKYKANLQALINNHTLDVMGMRAVLVQLSNKNDPYITEKSFIIDELIKKQKAVEKQMFLNMLSLSDTQGCAAQAREFLNAFPKIRIAEIIAENYDEFYDTYSSGGNKNYGAGIIANSLNAAAENVGIPERLYKHDGYVYNSMEMSATKGKNHRILVGRPDQIGKLADNWTGTCQGNFPEYQKLATKIVSEYKRQASKHKNSWAIVGIPQL